MNEEVLTRSEFCNIIADVFNVHMELLYNKFESSSLSETESYIFYHDEVGDVSIIAKYSLYGNPLVINWYMLYHIGRCLKLHGIIDEEHLRYVLNDVLVELLDEKRSDEAWQG